MMDPSNDNHHASGNDDHVIPEDDLEYHMEMMAAMEDGADADDNRDGDRAAISNESVTTGGDEEGTGTTDSTGGAGSSIPSTSSLFVATSSSYGVDVDMVSMFSALPMCMVILRFVGRADGVEGEDGAAWHPVAANQLFEQHMGPLYKFENGDFCQNVCEGATDRVTNFYYEEEQRNDEDGDDRARENALYGDSRERLRAALREALRRPVGADRIRLRRVEMTTVSDYGQRQGFPIRRQFDWFIRRIDEQHVVLLGDPCWNNAQEEAKESGDYQSHQRKQQQEAELIDFFQNAPIALHWLSGEGIVLWANQTELNVLGYTAKEYIGQPIMKFCPDEEELVLEIFKQLGSGNAIKDVPVRFRTKEGKLVYLLIDSNVKYNPDGSFGHTRCFIRDDTGRKVRQAKATLLLQETQRSLQRMDAFMARTLHHMRTPLYMTQHILDTIATQRIMSPANNGNGNGNHVNDTIFHMAAEQITSGLHLLEDISDLGKFDQGLAVHASPTPTSLTNFGTSFLEYLPEPKTSEVKLVLEMAPQTEKILFSTGPNSAGPDVIMADSQILFRLLNNLFAHAMATTEKGVVALRIGYSNQQRLTFAVSDTGPGMEMAPNAAAGDLPLIFQKYHQELPPNFESFINIDVIEQAGDEVRRRKEVLEQSMESLALQRIAIGLSLSYHLVQSLGGELRCSSVMGQGTTFWFSLPRSVSTIASASAIALEPLKLVKKKKKTQTQDLKALPRPAITPSLPAGSVPGTSSSPSGSDGTEDGNDRFTKRKKCTFEKPDHCQLPSTSMATLASRGVASQNAPSILVVEDTIPCAKFLCTTLNRFQCSTKWAANGQEALDIIEQFTPGTFDLIMMDLRMPVMDGLEATKVLKSQWGIVTPVVAVTGDVLFETQDECKKIGFDAFYSKPLRRDDLKQIILQFTGYQVK